MGAGMKLVTSVLREAERSAKAAASERARIAREQERRERQLERERIRQEKEDERLSVRLSKEKAKAEKEKIKTNLEKETKEFDKRIESRKKLRLEFLNKVHS